MTGGAVEPDIVDSRSSSFGSVEFVLAGEAKAGNPVDRDAGDALGEAVRRSASGGSCEAEEVGVTFSIDPLRLSASGTGSRGIVVELGVPADPLAERDGVTCDFVLVNLPLSDHPFFSLSLSPAAELPDNDTRLGFRCCLIGEGGGRPFPREEGDSVEPVCRGGRFEGRGIGDASAFVGSTRAAGMEEVGVEGSGIGSGGEDRLASIEAGGRGGIGGASS